MSTRFSIASLLPLLVVLSDCAVQRQDAQDAEMRATEPSAQQSVDQQKAEAKAHLADYDLLTGTWKSPFQEYADCNSRASRAVARQTGDPASLAVAAHSLCRRTEANLRKAVYAANEENPDFGNDTMEKLRRAILEDNKRDIVAARAAATAPRHSPEPDIPPTDKRI